MKRDNLKEYREEKVQKNTELLKRSICHIQEYGGKISMSNISKVSYDIAREGEAGLSVPALSKNKSYKNLIEQAKLESSDGPVALKPEALSSKTLKDMSQAELIAEIYKLRIQEEHHMRELRSLQDIMSTYKINQIDKPKGKSVLDKERVFALKHAINTLLANDILYVEQETFDVKLAAFGTLILKGSVYKNIFNDEASNETVQGKSN